ncbi:hypothetical protein H310_01466 [Aphanomyces invadans]|uniref:PDZ domain-containing protein n=1 Tax=Aphanomyces invadans TaxID=157072 RepID=A0A024USV1_9STRA|nr:hypothetical protein H310_01466 [Aphanomyces invadans]ETW08992.1 hypothetical protein H310_01466 [Aphanomyces invadans]|eukprot:XP_008862797.1 hypothetical protein H310_01466 [Aphanomyces invadans]
MNENNAVGEYTVEYVFHECGDLGMCLKFPTNGDVIVQKLEPVIGLAERSCPNLQEGDVLVSINDTPTTDMAFSDVMKHLRDTLAASSAKGLKTSLTFVPVEGSFDTAEKAVENWRRQEQSFKDDGEFEVDFPPSQPLGFRLTESYIMAKPLCLESTSLSELTPLLHHAIVQVNDHLVLGAPFQDVLQLLQDAASFPKQIWFWKLAPGHDRVYKVVTIASAALLQTMQLSPVDLMFEVPIVHSILPTPRSKLPVTAPPSHFLCQPPIRNDGIRKEQYLMAINGISTLTVPNADNTASAESSVSMLHRVMESSLHLPRRLSFRDIELYKSEFQSKRPLSPWRRTVRSTESSSAPRGPLADAVTIQVVSKPFSALVTENATSIPHVDPTIEPVRRKWQHGKSRCVEISPSTGPLGLQLETDFSSKFTVFKRYVRTNTVKRKTICVGDRILFVNGVPVKDIPKEKLEQLIKGHAEPRKFTVGRTKTSPKGPWSAISSWIHHLRSTPQIRHFHPIQ